MVCLVGWLVGLVGWFLPLPPSFCCDAARHGDGHHQRRLCGSRALTIKPPTRARHRIGSFSRAPGGYRTQEFSFYTLRLNSLFSLILATIFLNFRHPRSAPARWALPPPAPSQLGAHSVVLSTNTQQSLQRLGRPLIPTRAFEPPAAHAATSRCCARRQSPRPLMVPGSRPDRVRARSAPYICRRHTHCLPIPPLVCCCR